MFLEDEEPTLMKRDHGRGPRHGGRGGLDNISQTHENANPQKDKSMIK